MNLLSLKDLRYRFAFLLCLPSGQRSFSLDNKSIEDSKVRLTITEKLKHTRAGTHKKPLEFLAYPILGSPILIVVSVICRDQCIYYLYYVLYIN